MRKIIFLILIILLKPADDLLTQQPPASVVLPKPQTSSDVSIEQALQARRSVRSYKAAPLEIADVSQLLWAAQGITNERNYRTAPSAGALFPLETYLISYNVTDLTAGIYKYDPLQHELHLIKEGNFQQEVAAAAYNQSCLRNAPLAIVINGVYERTTGKYGERGVKYVHMEVGHSAQNIHLQAVSLSLGTVVVGAFNDNELSEIMSLPDQEKPLYIMPVGRIH